MTADELAEVIKHLPRKNGKLTVVAISGFGGAGKSTLAAKLAALLGGAEMVPIDDFIVGSKNMRSGDWATFDRERLRASVLEVARPDKPVGYQQYNSGEWVEGRGGRWREIRPHRYLIIEGCGILHPSLMPYFDFSIWIDCPEVVALSRAEKRDVAAGNDDRELWEHVWRQNDLEYFNNFHPDKLASLVLDQQT